MSRGQTGSDAMIYTSVQLDLKQHQRVQLRRPDLPLLSTSCISLQPSPSMQRSSIYSKLPLSDGAPHTEALFTGRR